MKSRSDDGPNEGGAWIPNPAWETAEYDLEFYNFDVIRVGNPPPWPDDPKKPCDDFKP